MLHAIALNAGRVSPAAGRFHAHSARVSGQYEVRLADSSHDRLAAAALVARRYAWRGYPYPTKPTVDLSNQMTLVVWDGEDAVATLTLRRDSVEGLLSENLYGDEIDALRRESKVLCEVTRLATDCDDHNRTVLALLFRAAHSHGRARFGATDAVIEVNPRHAAFYQREFRFSRIGGVRHCPRVEAPAVLLHRSVDAFALPVPIAEERVSRQLINDRSASAAMA